MRRLYTVESATKTLPYGRSIVGEVRLLFGDIQEMSTQHKEAEKEQRAELRRAIQENAARLKECQEELWAIGVELKDFDQGIVDFPAELDGRAIHLCWEYGEHEIAFWHETSAGYFGRQPVPEDEPAWPPVPASAASAGRA